MNLLIVKEMVENIKIILTNRYQIDDVLSSSAESSHRRSAVWICNARQMDMRSRLSAFRWLNARMMIIFCSDEILA